MIFEKIILLVLAEKIALAGRGHVSRGLVGESRESCAICPIRASIAYDLFRLFF
jgi:hypothetical protein